MTPANLSGGVAPWGAATFPGVVTTPDARNVLGGANSSDTGTGAAELVQAELAPVIARMIGDVGAEALITRAVLAALVAANPYQRGHVDEFDYMAAVASVTNTLTLLAQFRNRERINVILVVLPTGATNGLLTLGARQLPVAAGLNTFYGLAMELDYKDKRTLTFTAGAGGGYASLEIMGEELPVPFLRWQ